MMPYIGDGGKERSGFEVKFFVLHSLSTCVFFVRLLNIVDFEP